MLPPYKESKSCALLILNRSRTGLEGSAVIPGEILRNKAEAVFSFEDGTFGFPLPRRWIHNVYATPSDKSELVLGCEYFVAVSRKDASKTLQMFDIEKHSYTCMA